MLRGRGNEKEMGAPGRWRAGFWRGRHRVGRARGLGGPWGIWLLNSLEGEDR